MRNLTYLNEYCPVDPPTSAVLDFGIFADAVESSRLTKTDFVRKFFRSFWWGLRNLSSFGQNLDISSYVVENLVAVLISILALLLFLYLIGNLQKSIQMATTRASVGNKNLGREKAREEHNGAKGRAMDIKKHHPDLKLKIMRCVRLRLQEGKDVDVGHLIHILPFAPGMLLKPVTYTEKSYIFRKGEPLDMMLFVTVGVVWSFGSSSCPMECLQKGDHYGKQLVEWQLSSTSYSEFPISQAKLKCHTKVEVFVLMTIDLEHLLSSFWGKFPFPRSTEFTSEGLKPFAAASLQRGFRRYIWKRRARKHHIHEQFNLRLDIIS
ncbi:hypothetical protein TIFTF001_038521 [Ficus carica]|uniref:Cyclic nucleotide-binding domain-containing protein n=1 Tax=Ficus carica TaxID=3494 RepID=A0AA88JES6_FICCA|nr:hypothetical protein TIFTF001_038521 [Ficus carica]